MKEKIIEFELILNELATSNNFSEASDFEIKASEKKWSKKEIVGHLVDSALNNIQRFTEIQTFEKPYKIRAYNPDDLVKSNDYQNKNNQELFNLFLNLNRQIVHVIKNQTAETLKFQLILPNEQLSDLEFLISDYFDHFFYHLAQIKAL